MNMSTVRTTIPEARADRIPSVACAQDEEADKTSLRAHLLRDFGVDLPLEGGFGEKCSPIVVTAPDMQQAVEVQMQVLACHGKKRRVTWRLLDQQVVAPTSRVVRTSLQTVELTATEVVTQEEGLYFSLDALPTGASALDLPLPRGFADARSGLRLPHQIGWLHYERMEDDEPEAPGLGCSAHYSVPGINASVYVYDKGRSDIPADLKSDVVLEEYRTAVRDVLTVRRDKGAKLVSQGFAGGGTGPAKFALAILELHEPMMSAVMLASWNGYFVKGRVSWNASEKRRHEIAHESIQAIMEAVHPATQVAGQSSPS